MIRRWLFLLIAMAMAATYPAPALADDFRPAYLELKQTAADTYDVLWKVPALDENRLLKVRPEFPPGTAAISPQSTYYANGAAVQRWSIRIAGGLEGKAVAFPQLLQSRTDVLARLTRADGSTQLERILAVDPQFIVEASPRPFEVVQTYTVLGIEHILTGFDHLCFVLALVLLVRGNRRLFWTVTAFTLAHSLTLALATLGVVRVPRPPVEATIALSIVFVANEIIQRERGREGLAAKQPWLVAFAFGLLHGLGFAGALAEVGLPHNSIPLALLFFNVGVEIGQLLFVVAVLAIARLAALIVAKRIDLRRLSPVPAYAIGGIAGFWAIERIYSFWN